MTARGRVVRWVLLAVSLLLAWRYVDFHAFAHSIASIRPWQILVVIAVVTVDRFVTGYKWHYIGESLGVRLPYWECVKTYYASTVLGYVMPTSVAADAYRGLRMAAPDQPKGPVFATIILEKVIITVASLLWAWVGFAVLARDLSPMARRWVFVNFALLTAVAAVATAVSVQPTAHARAVAFLRRLGLNALVDRLDRAFEAYAGFAHRRGRLLIAIGLGVFENLWDYAAYFLAGLFLSVPASPAMFFAVIVMNHVVRKLAMYAHSWSVAEAITVAAYGLVGIPPHEALAISLLRTAISAVAVLPGALILFRSGTKRSGLRNVKSGSHLPEEP